jgi:hypothetical protein
VVYERTLNRNRSSYTQTYQGIRQGSRNILGLISAWYSLIEVTCHDKR